MKNIADFVVFSDDYGRHPSSCQHLIRRFLPENRVLWVNTVGLRPPSFSSYDLGRIFQKLLEWLRPLRQAEKNLWVYAPISLPWNRIGWIRNWNRRRAVAGIQKVLKKLAFRDVVSLTTVPNVSDWIGNFGEKLKIYYCTDDYSEWPGLEKETLLKMERELVGKADLFVPVSKKLMELKRMTTAVPTLFLPHGVDLEHFKKAYSPLQSRSPVIGYFGLIDMRLDFDLMLRLMMKNRGCDWRFLGPVQACPPALKNMPHVRFLPPVAYEDLPRAIASWDLLVLPYRRDRLAEASNPLKLRECIATGKPVATLDLPWSELYRDVVHLCRSEREWEQILEQLVSGKIKPEPEKQWKRMEEESWEKRAETLGEAIERELRKN